MSETKYNDKNLKILMEMVKNCAEPCEDCPSYPVEIRGRAHSYAEAEILVDKLQYQPYVYSTDNDASAKRKAKEDEKFFKSNKQSLSTATGMLESAKKNLNSDTDTEPESDSHKVNNRKRKRANPSESSSSESSKLTSSDDEPIGRIKKPKGSNIVKKIETIDNFNSKKDFSHHTGTGSQVSSRTMPKNFQVIKELLTETKSHLISSFAQELKNVTVELKSLTKTVNDLKGSVIEIKKMHELNSSATCSSIEFESGNDYGISLPCQTVSDFDKFNEKLKSTQDYRSTIIRKLLTQININQAMTKSVGVMMRLIMSKEVALLYNLKKANTKKTKLFIETEFYTVLKMILMKKFSKSKDDPLSDSAISNSISSVLIHCGDWEGGRTVRKKTNLQKTTNEIEKTANDGNDNRHEIETHKGNGENDQDNF